MRKLTAVDMFCGAGGFTEGFKQNGIEVAACLDNWAPAVETHRRNHPDTEVFQADILQFDSGNLPKADILIGSPPCTEFSYANRGGHGDQGLGMQFVLRFLRFVHETRPRYWIMENVPRLLQSLPARVPLRRLGLAEDGFLEIPVRKVLNSADFGAPQKRLRLISGSFPLPAQTHAWTGGLGSFSDLKPWVPVRAVVGLLPDPLGRPDPNNVAHDPSFDLQIPETDLTEHFMDTRLNPEEIRINKKSKTDHSWYGRMAFPDPLDRPARTVMATQTGISRETLVLEWSHDGRASFRRPTIRECACFQSFPITYQFWGSSAQIRYKLVGNAVPTALAGALARAVVEREGGKAPAVPILERAVGERPRPVRIPRGSTRPKASRYSPDRRYRDHIAGSKSGGIRVDLANVAVMGSPDGATNFDVRWEARLVAGSGKSVVLASPKFTDAVGALVRWAGSHGDSRRVGRFFNSLAKTLTPVVPGRVELQAAWVGAAPRGTVSPPQLLRKAATIVDAHFPEEKFANLAIPVPRAFPRIGRSTVPIRRVAQYVALAFIAETTNRGSAAQPLQILTDQLGSINSTGSSGRRSVLGIALS
jgi:DNA (cytosine-5)-methyltransferase 1